MAYAWCSTDLGSVVSGWDHQSVVFLGRRWATWHTRQLGRVSGLVAHAWELLLSVCCLRPMWRFAPYLASWAIASDSWRALCGLPGHWVGAWPERELVEGQSGCHCKRAPWEPFRLCGRPVWVPPS